MTLRSSERKHRERGRTESEFHLVIVLMRKALDYDEAAAEEITIDNAINFELSDEEEEDGHKMRMEHQWKCNEASE